MNAYRERESREKAGGTEELEGERNAGTRERWRI